MSETAETAEWFYLRAGEQVGPLAGSAIRRLVASGQVGRDDLVYHPDFADWTPVGHAPALAPLLPREAPPTRAVEVAAAPANVAIDETDGGESLTSAAQTAIMARLHSAPAATDEAPTITGRTPLAVVGMILGIALTVWSAGRFIDHLYVGEVRGRGVLPAWLFPADQAYCAARALVSVWLILVCLRLFKSGTAGQLRAYAVASLGLSTLFLLTLAASATGSVTDRAMQAVLLGSGIPLVVVTVFDVIALLTARRSRRRPRGQ